MDPVSIPKMLYQGDGIQILDPGASGTITVNRTPCTVPLVSATTETRTLARPTRLGASVFLYVKTYVGAITLTVTGGYNTNSDTTYVFGAAGTFAQFESAYDGSAYYWRLVSCDLLGTQTTPAEIVITTNVITAAESGRTYYLTLAAGFTSTLPAPALGLMYRFVVATAPTGAPYVITTNGGANLLYGMMLERAGGAGVAGAAQDTLNLVHNQSIIGDWVEFYSNGTNWHYHGMTDVAAGSTVAVS